MAAAASHFVPAYAKVNLSLDVLGKRDDGYHALASVMQTVALHDTLRLAPVEEGAITFDCDRPDLNTADNLAVRAAQLLRETDTSERGIHIELQKQIPSQAGMGGGSSDAAAVLTALNRIWQRHISVGRLEELGASLGSDVPFFIRGGTALIEGRGERVTSLPDAEPLWLVLVKPPMSIPTPDVFRRLSPSDYSSGEHTRALVAAISSRKSLPLDHMFNALEPGVFTAYPEVAATRTRLLAAGAPTVCLSGSGPTLFAPFRGLAQACAVMRGMEGYNGSVWLTYTVSATAHREPT